MHRYNTFIQEMLSDLKSGKSQTLPKDKFEMIKHARLAAFKTPNLNIISLGAKMVTILDNYDGDFETLEKKHQITQGLAYQHVIDVAHRVFTPENKRRLAVVYTKVRPYPWR